MTDPGDRGGGTEAAEPRDRSRDDEGAAPGEREDEREDSEGAGAVEPAIRRIDRDDGGDGGPPDGDASAPIPEPDGERRTLNPRIRLVWLTRALVGTMVATAVAALVSVVAVDGALWVPIATFLLVGGAATWLARARYRRWAYYLREDSLLLDRGVITRVRTVVPYVRIQHVDTRRGPVERALGLASVVVYTAGSRGADVTVPGLTHDRAEELQDRLKRIAIRAEGEDAV